MSANRRIRDVGRRADTFEMEMPQIQVPQIEMPIRLRCPQCGTEFQSAIQMDRETWIKIRVEDNIERCRGCGFSKRYQKADYFFA
jgi:hypothetical protein